MPHFMIVLIPYINLLNLSWIVKCLFLRNMEPLSFNFIHIIGDIGKQDEDGFLFIVDRLKELIKYKANAIAPASLEDILLQHDSVADVGVIGVPDEEAGELPRAYVVKKAGMEVTGAELQDFVAGTCN